MMGTQTTFSNQKYIGFRGGYKKIESSKKSKNALMSGKKVKIVKNESA